MCNITDKMSHYSQLISKYQLYMNQKHIQTDLRSSAVLPLAVCVVVVVLTSPRSVYIAYSWPIPISKRKEALHAQPLLV